MTWHPARRYLFAALLLSSATSYAADPPAKQPTEQQPRPVETSVVAPLDYLTLTHKLSIDSLRAGSHDESGTNDYFFTVSMYGLLNSTEERNAPFETRKKILVDLGTFGDTQIASLALWKPDEKLKNYKELTIDGNGLRELAARAMTELKVQESDLAIMVEVAMYERQKKFFFFGDDTFVAKAAYYPIPLTKFDAPLRKDQSLLIADDKGTQVTVGVRYASSDKK